MTVVLDSWAVLRYLDDDGHAAEAIARLLEDDRPVMSWINLGEVFYVIRRSAGEGPASATVRERWQARDAGLQEGIAGVETVKVFGRRRHEVKRFIRLTINGFRANMRLFYMQTMMQQHIINGILPFVKTTLVRVYFLRQVILGEPDPARTGGDTAGLTARLLRRNTETARTGDPEAATGRIVDIVRHVADLLAAFDEKLAAGDILICGSVLPPVLVEGDETAVAYALDPIGTISVAFTR